MTAIPPTQADPVPNIQQLRISDLSTCLRAGWDDFRAAPQFGLFFSGVYVIAGLLLLQIGAGFFTWTLTLSLGFPLIAPILAVGLYDVSRRRAQGEAPRFADVLAIMWRERTRQIPWAGAMIVTYFLFWTFLAHMVFALFLGPSALMGRANDLQSYLTATGVAMIGTELLLGAVLAYFLFALTAISLPLLLDRELDFVTAMLLSLQVTRKNMLVMFCWGLIIAVLTFLALLPWLLGLLVVLPVLGHASWHLYRHALS